MQGLVTLWLTVLVSAPELPEFNDAHFHLTNYVQEGPSMQAVSDLVGKRVGRIAIFGIPLQQEWSYRVSGRFAPTYYLQSDAPLYYYSFVDAHIATAYLALPLAERQRLDPMITGFNPTDMYAVDHIRRVLTTFPGVFSGIGEFTVHKEFVSAKIAGTTPSLTDPALDRILDFAGEAGLLVILHNDVSAPFPKDGDDPAYATQLRDLFRRHPRTTIIWAHMGLGRVITPPEHYVARLDDVLDDPTLRHVHFDLSWLETAKYITRSELATRRTATLINRHPTRFLFGTDEVGSTERASYFLPFETYAPLWKLLSREASELVRLGNYERLFDEARRRVRAWEKQNVRTAATMPERGMQ